MSYPNDAIHEESYKGYAIKIYPDDSPPNPREDFDPMGTIAAVSRPYRRSSLSSDKNAITLPDADDYRRGTVAAKSPGVFQHRYLTMFCDIALALPLWYSEHGPSCRVWTGSLDKGDEPDGFIYISNDKLKEEYGDDPDAIKKATEYLGYEIAEYSAWMNGDVYGYEIERERVLDIDEEDPCDADTEDSCWGFYGQDDAISAAKEAVDGIVGTNTKAA